MGVAPKATIELGGRHGECDCVCCRVFGDGPIPVTSGVPRFANLPLRINTLCYRIDVWALPLPVFNRLAGALAEREGADVVPVKRYLYRCGLVLHVPAEAPETGAASRERKGGLWGLVGRIVAKGKG